MKESDIWVYLEHDGSEIEEVSLEILGTIREIADRFGHRVTGVILGNAASSLAKDAIGYGADTVLIIEHPDLEEYGTELFTGALFDIVTKRKPDSLLVGATINGRDLAARLAARLRTGLAANVVTLDMDEEGTLYSGVPGYGSKIIANIVCVKNKPQMSTVRGGVFSKGNFKTERKGETEIIKPRLEGMKNRVKVMTRMKEDSIDITSSDKVVVAGNGVSRDVQLVRRLSELIGADIGVTRPVADKGLFPRDVQVGSTGVSLKAKNVLILGSSGSEHFITGISNCSTVISIDTDPKTEMFDYSDYCVVGDASKILSEIVKELGMVRQ